MSAAVRGNPGAKRGTLAPSDSHAKRRRNEEDEDDAYLDDDDDGGGAAGGMDEEDFDMMEQVEAEIALEMDEGQEAPPDEDDAAGAEAEVESDEAEVDYRRPPLKPFDRKTQSIAFQWVDIDTTSGPRLQVDPKTGRAPAIDSKEDITPHIRLYGVTEEGHSIFAHVHGFLPYFYIPCPSSFNSVAHCTALKDSLTRALRSKERGDETRLKDPCLGIGFKMDQSTLLGYTFNRKATFLRVVMAMPSLVTKAKNILTDGLHVQGFGPFSISSTYESNVPFVLRFMVDKEIQGANWLELPAGSYSVREAHKKKSRCQLEVDIYYEHIISHQPEGEWSKIAPLRILSFDIECAGRKGIFPEADKDPVIQIANTVSIQGQSELLVKNVFTLDGCSAIPGAKVVSSSEEVDLLCKWSEFVRVADPDIITGYNIQNFDVPYLLGRGKALGKFSAANAKTLSTYFEWGRLRGANCVMRDTTFQSSAYGKRENVETTIHGRVMFDMLPYMFRNHKLSSYSLNSVSAEYLGQQKEDVHYSVISDLQRGSDDDRRRLAVYCIKDAHLPLLLMEKLSVMVNYIEMARVTGVPLNFLLTRGQQIKVFSMLLRKCQKCNLIIPNLPKSKNDGDTYEGATVIDPKKAFYDEPIATLDFASLYPSIMQAYNLCYSTLIPRNEISQLKPEQYEKSPSGDFFVTKTTQKGILPQILDELLAARKRAKKDMAAATDPTVKAVQNGRQLALKVSANSVYGFTGATVGQLPCLPIASSVTAYGRELLLKTRTHVEATYTIENGYPADAEVVYGDTDSVMVKFGISDMHQAMPLAEKAAAEVSNIFPDPIKLEFEKVYMPYLLMNKKRYAGLLWTRPEKFDKMDTKGLETVRRDNCMLVRKLVETCLQKILIERNVQGAISFSKEVISQLLQNKIDISLLVISKSLGKGSDGDDYANKQAHVELAMRMRKRDPGTAPNVGDRVPYVIVEGAKNAPAYERSEDPVYVLENNLSIDTKYYLTNQLAKPLERLFEPIIDNPSSLLQGDHTRVVVRKTPTARKGTITGFAKVKATCLGCKTPMPEGKGSLCQFCIPKEAQIYAAAQSEVNTQQVMYSRLWTQCQSCQGSFHQDVICSNQDCPIFYKRKKVQLDLRDAMKRLDKLAW